MNNLGEQFFALIVDKCHSAEPHQDGIGREFASFDFPASLEFQNPWTSQSAFDLE